MNGIFMDIFEDSVSFVASDTHKLVRFKNQGIAPGVRAAFILPKKPANLLKAILPKESGKVELAFDSKNACFKLSDFVLNCRLIEGNYPNYNSVIPTNNPNRLIIDRALFVNVLRRVSVFADAALGLAKLQLKNGELVVSTENKDYSISAEEKVACNYTADDLTIGFKASFLIEILNNISATEVLVELSDPTRAGVILPLENKENEEKTNENVDKKEEKKEEKKKNYFLLSFHLKKSSYPIRGFFLLSSKQCISIFIFLNCGITDAAPPFKPHILAACVGVINPWCLFQRCVNHLP